MRYGFSHASLAMPLQFICTFFFACLRHIDTTDIIFILYFDYSMLILYDIICFRYDIAKNKCFTLLRL